MVLQFCNMEEAVILYFINKTTRSVIIRNILILIKYFHICVAITSCYKLTNSAAMNYFLCGFTGVFWCAGMICFLCSTNIQQIILPADNQRHTNTLM